MKFGRTILQSLIGLVIAVAAFMGGLFLCSRIPGAGGKWLSGLGEMVMGSVLFVCCASAGLALRFRAHSLLVSAGLILVFLMAIGELSDNWHYTALPVALSAAVLFTVGLIKQHAHARKC
jgi:hypothetical protein